MISENKKKNTFLQELKAQNTLFKKFYKDNPDTFKSSITNSKKHQRAEKTRSKSKRKRQLKEIHFQQVRKSGRLNVDHECFQIDKEPLWHQGKKKVKINSQVQKQLLVAQHFSPSKKNQNKRQKEFLFFQLQKQPLWHPKRRERQSRYSKISDQITIKEYSQPTKPKSSDPLYEFYSSYQLPEFRQHIEGEKIDVIKQSKEKNQDEEVYQYQIKQMKIEKQQNQKERLNCEGIQNRKDEELQKILRQLAESQVDQKQIQGWFPSKYESSMLAIQKLIDDYFMFRLSMRNNSTARVADVIKYIRDINGYFFSLDVLTDMLQINPKLYKIIIMDNQKYLKCPKLTLNSIQRRILSTKTKMKKKSMKEQAIYEDQV